MDRMLRIQDSLQLILIVDLLGKNVKLDKFNYGSFNIFNARNFIPNNNNNNTYVNAIRAYYDDLKIIYMNNLK